MIPVIAAVADNDVINLRRVDARALRQRLQHLGEQLLGMDVVEGAAGLPLPAWRSRAVDDPRLAHGASSISTRTGVACDTVGSLRRFNRRPAQPAGEPSRVHPNEATFT